jgi:hypothetical protein
MRKLLLATAALLAMTASSHALIITDLGNNPNSATGHFSNSVLGTTFDDQYTFHLVNFPQFITFASATNDFTQPSDFITNFTGQLFSSGANGLPGGGDDVAVGPLVLATACPTNPLGCQVLAGNAILGPGNYFLDVSGVGGGTSGYGGDLTTRGVAAVPGPIVGAGIPGLLAMFGLGGWAWRRRKIAS